MRAVDTNLLVRFLTADHPGQFARARQIMEDGEIFIATTVLLETEWVLRSTYKLSAPTVARLLGDLAGLPGVRLQDRRAMAEALEALTHGLDFADALHLASARGCEAFVTFDRALVRRAAAFSAMEVREP